MNIPKIENMTSPRSGNEVANQFVIKTDEGEYFQSYNTIIAFIPKGVFTKYQAENGENKIVLDINSWDYSRTTSKYRNEFLNEDTKETRRKIENGTYLLADLNK